MTVIRISDRELTRLRVMIDFADGRLTIEAAGGLMGLDLFINTHRDLSRFHATVTVLALCGLPTIMLDFSPAR